MKKLNICFVTEDFYPEFIGGQGVYGYHLVRELTKLGHPVTVLAEKRGKREKFWEGKKNVRLIRVPYCFGNKLMLAILEYIFFLKFCGRENFDITHLNGLSGLFFTIFKPKNAGKIIVMDHNTNYEMSLHTRSRLKKVIYPWLIHLEKKLFERADGILFNNPQEEGNVKKYYRIDQKPTRSVYLGVEMAEFSLAEQRRVRLRIRRRFGWPDDAKIVLYVGRLVERKRVDTLIKALEYYARKASPSEPIRTELYGVIIGNGPDRSRLEKTAPPNVFFLGWTYEPREYYLAADLFVTVSEAEGGFLITALEAASYGLPLILSPSAAGLPIIKEGISGFIVDPDDSKKLADRITKITPKMGRESKQLAKQFNWKKCAGETIRFYQLVEKP